MTFLYIDVETTGLEPGYHEVWEIAYAIDGGEVATAVVPHVGITADPEALEVNGYNNRQGWDDEFWVPNFEHYLRSRIRDGAPVTLVGANPRFDAAFLKARWGIEPWHYRLLDIEAYAMGALGYEVPSSLKNVVADLRDLGYEITESDHTAANDVRAVRDAHHALQDIYSKGSN